MTLGEKIRLIRKKKKLSQKELAQKIGMHENHLGRYENGLSEPTAPVLKKICEALDVPADYLLFDNKENSPASKVTDKELLEQFELVDKFTDDDKKIVKVVLDAFISRNKIKDIVKAG
ncbi:MAG TPA: helix-turn-helix domain-containing protein [Spirochaetota bacterium]|nr:helix-turn-helix domain-containing protein [Spirochaetota bacterium]